jgi:hypothetical protein
MRHGVLIGCLLVCGVAAGFPREPQPGATTWGYVEAVEGQAVTLDDGTVLRLTDKTQVIRTDGTPGALADVVRNVKAVAAIAEDGTVARLELFRRPDWQETYLVSTSTAGANIVSVAVNGRVYPRSLALLRGSFSYRSQYTRACFEGDVTYRPDKGPTAPPKVRFSVLSQAGEVCFERSVAPNEVAHFRINWGQGDRTFTLFARPEGPGPLRPEWCVWLDPRFTSGPTIPPGGFCIYQRTTRQLLDGLRKALGERKIEKVAISQLGGVRVTDSGALPQLQEDLVVLGAQIFDIVGKYDARLELGVPVSDEHKQKLQKLGAKYILVGTVSDRGELVVINAALVNVESNEVVATARATQ